MAVNTSSASIEPTLQPDGSTSGNFTLENILGMNHEAVEHPQLKEKENNVEMNDSDEELSHISIEASKAPISTQLLGAQPTIGSKVGEWFIDHSKYIPLQLTYAGKRAEHLSATDCPSPLSHSHSPPCLLPFTCSCPLSVFV
ncbi:uncharacterized protein HD556DRAFT_1501514 [Suillus plorans]|uniref:Uncharacterized protein n=1 Tax=Suillus plorans TaxID=116603 RepID=A0A9P7AEA8_9AGAM|nr:uncharacterized protein HD556DRAFT_1501514 [Suillus plorans]KAG1787616.1 hypothetical protein HD556DRAFT_1501514 [Suillus plorans]